MEWTMLIAASSLPKSLSLTAPKLKKIKSPQLKEQNIWKSRSFICIKHFLKSDESQHIVIFKPHHYMEHQYLSLVNKFW